MTTRNPEDELLKALRERAAERTDLRRTLKYMTRAALAGATMALLGAALALFLAVNLRAARAELRAAHADIAAQSAWIDALESELNAASKPDPDAITEDDLAFAEDLSRLAGVDEQLEAAGFASVEEALEHLALHHGQLSRCSASLGDCRSWLGWCQGGFWRPEVGP